MDDLERAENHQDESEAAAAGEERAADAPRRVLIVEDDPDLWEMLKLTLLAIDPEMQIDFVDNAEDGVDRMSGGGIYELVMSDFLLADSKNGYWLRDHCERLQPEARFAMMSSMPIGALGDDDCPFLRKPFTLSDCRAFVETLLR